MRPVLVRALLASSLFATTTADAQHAQPGALDWSIGVARGLGGSSVGGAAHWRQERTGSLLLEWRRAERRLGVRLELAQAIEDRGFALGACDGCTSATEGTSRTLLLSSLYEFRRQSRFRVHLGLGAGLHVTEVAYTSNARCDFVGGEFACVRLEATAPAQRTRALLGALAGTAGASLNLARFVLFGESRLLFTPEGASTTTTPAPLSVGLRIRPE